MGKRIQLKKPHYAALVSLIAGIFISVVTGICVYWLETREESIRFEAQADQVQSRIRARMESFENFLIQARGFLQSKKVITREEFHKYSADIQLSERYVSVQGLAYITQVHKQDLAKYVQQVRSLGNSDYKIWPEQTQTEYYPITYIEPVDWRNKRALGFEMFSEPIRRMALEKARDTALPTLSGKVKLVQEAGEEIQPGFLMFLPIYKEGANADTVDNRRLALTGFLGIPVRAHDFFKIIFKDQNPLVDFEVYDGSQITTDSLLYDFDGKPYATHREIRKLELAGHVYTVAFNPLSEATIFPRLPALVTLFGIIISALISWIIRAVRRRAEESKRAEQKLTQLADSMTQLAWIAGPDGNIFWYNQRWYDYTGTSLREMEGWGWKKVHHPDHVERVTNFVQEAWRHAEPWELTFPLRGKNGEWRWFLTRAVPLTDSSRKIVQWFGTNTDITTEIKTQQELLRRTAELESLQSELLKAAEQANEASKLKSAFLANMSHEIRTPLGAMIGFADLLRDPGLTQTEKANYVDVLTRNGENLAVIINDILDLSKVEAGHLSLEFTDISPSQIAEEVVSLLRVKAKEKDLIFEYNAEDSSPEMIVADSGRLKQILINLVGNAIKFTQFGSVKIRSYGCHTENGRKAICYDISDTGIGIPASQIEKVFLMFVQGDGSMTRRFGGTGLGLALSKSLAIEMGGDVSITKTQEGVGTTFKVMIADQPDKKTDGNKIEKIVRKSELLGDQLLKGLHILVVDDAPDNQQLIWRYLTKQGAIVESVDNGLLGYRAAITGDFDLVLMDIQMPLMDGYTATQKLRENGYLKPIIALTAHAMSEVRKKSLNVGYTDHLTKPINRNELISTIVRYTKKT
ncbi:MAG: CHASE domain-containing protein [Bdellovibrionaceae bacterium]|nr:CHASE domain-containing protein [Bdellovibrio sp.]